MKDGEYLIDTELLQIAAENAGKWLVVCGAHLVGHGDEPIYGTYEEAVSAARDAERAAQERGEPCVAFIGQVPA